MPEVVVATARAHQIPAVFLQHSDNIANLHTGIMTDGYEIVQFDGALRQRRNGHAVRDLQGRIRAFRSDAVCATFALRWKEKTPRIEDRDTGLYRFQVLIEQDEDGYYVADVPALTGCHTQGKTVESNTSDPQVVRLFQSRIFRFAPSFPFRFRRNRTTFSIRTFRPLPDFTA